MPTVDVAGLPVGDGHPTRVMGVVNLSPESPYEPSVFADPSAAATHVDEVLVGAGADIVDIGLESANKRFEVRSPEWELDRLDLALEVLERIESGVVLSLETRYAAVAEAALDAGFDMINDIAGFADPDLPAVCAERNAAVVKMAGPGNLERPGALESVDEIYAALERGGLTDRTIVDPAFGGWTEAKTLEDDRETFRRLREFRGLDRPLLVSINRKNFLRKLAGRSTEAALPVSLAATALAVERGAHVVRTHDVAETRDAVVVADAFTPDRIHGDGVEELDVDTVRAAERHLAGLDTNPESVATGCVARMFRVEYLTPAEVDRLVSAAETAGAAVVAGDGRAVVGGTVRALRAVADRLADTSLDRVAVALS